jgi:hypothetical protein
MKNLIVAVYAILLMGTAQAGLLTYKLAPGSTITELGSNNAEALHGYFTWEVASVSGNSLSMSPKSLEFFSDSFSLSLNIRAFNNRGTSIFFVNDPNRCLSSSCLTGFGAVVTATGFDTSDAPLALGGFGAYSGEPLMPTSVSYENLSLLPDLGGRFLARVNLNAILVSAPPTISLPPTILMFLSGLVLLGLRHRKTQQVK